jgi:hypothetical protein
MTTISKGGEIGRFVVLREPLFPKEGVEVVQLLSEPHDAFRIAIRPSQTFQISD